MLRWLRIVIAFVLCVLWGIGAYAQSSASPSASCSLSPSGTLCKTVMTTFTQPSITLSSIVGVSSGRSRSNAASCSFATSAQMCRTVTSTFTQPSFAVDATVSVGKSTGGGGKNYPVTLTVACSLNPAASICRVTTENINQPNIAFEVAATAQKNIGSAKVANVTVTSLISPVASVHKNKFPSLTQPSVSVSATCQTCLTRSFTGEHVSVGVSVGAFVTHASGANFNVNALASLHVDTGVCRERTISGGESLTLSVSKSVCVTRNFSGETVAFATLPSVVKGMKKADNESVGIGVGITAKTGFSVPTSFGVSALATANFSRDKNVSANLTLSPQAQVLSSSGVSNAEAIAVSAADRIFKNASRPMFEGPHVVTSATALVNHRRLVVVAMNVTAQPTITRSLHANPTTSLSFGPAAFISSTKAPGVVGNANLFFAATARTSLTAKRSLSPSLSIAAISTKSVGWHKPDTSEFGVSAIVTAKVGFGRPVNENVSFSAIATVAVNGVPTQRRRGMIIEGM